ncbi:DUF3737 family protein [Hydrogeniiclostridium mannosilyticum]|uniref:DUF3737 family protein n=1 Tax=Hydrogeniiclostridium mannosilyticum TaxID=2764322 RepID=UPI0039B89D98
MPEQLRLLSAHRKRLLEWVRREERRMDCLDYLVYRLGKKHQAAMQAADSIDKEANEMEIIQNQVFDGERALYGSKGVAVRHCNFDGPADGESAFKECADIEVEDCRFNLRYPFWHNHGLKIKDSEMTEHCRAALWYSDHIEIADSELRGIKALRECSRVKMRGCAIVSPEFGWSADGVEMEDCTAESEYFMMRASRLHFKNVRMKGKYSFQYIERSVFENCVFDTKDAFWHAKNVVVRDSVVKGEYLAWYCENVTFERCRITGTQPLCYCKGLKLIDCEMEGADLAFERSEVQAAVTTPVISIKNPYAGRITAPAVGKIIRDDENAMGEVVIDGRLAGEKRACGCV